MLIYRVCSRGALAFNMQYKIIWDTPTKDGNRVNTQHIEADSDVEAVQRCFVERTLKRLQTGSIGGDVCCEAHPYSRTYFNFDL